MKRLWFVLFWIILTATTTSGFAEVPHLLGQEVTTVVPERFLRGYDPITVFFPTPPLGPDTQGPVDRYETLAERGVLRLTPQHPGEYLWIDARTLQFIPTIPWPALARFVVTVQEQTHPLLTLMSQPTEIAPHAGSTGLTPIKEMTLAFPVRLAPDALAAMFSFEVRNLPGLDDPTPLWLTQQDFALKEIERPGLHEPVRYQLTFHEPIPYGNHITLHVRLSLDETLEGTVARYTFETKPLFRLTGVGSGYRNLYPVAVKGSVYSKEQAMNREENSNPLYLQFSDRLGPVSMTQVKQLVRFEPAVENFWYEVSGRRLYLHFASDSETLYQLALRYQPLRDAAGRELAQFGETELYFFYPHADPYLRWKHSQGIVERYGPQKFPMEGRGDEQVDLRIYKLDPLDRNFWPFPDAPVEVDEARRPPGPGEEPDFAASIVEHIQLAGSPLVSQLVPLPMQEYPGDLRFGLDLKAHLAKISGAGRPGTYLVGYRRLGSTTIRHYVRVQVTDLSLSTIEEESAVTFVVTSLQTGQPAPGASIVVEGENDSGRWLPIISGVTDHNGRFRYEHTAPKARGRRIIVSRGDDTLVLNPEVAPPQFADNHWYNERSAWLGWTSDHPRHIKQRAYRKTHILTERPVYRPEEPVHIKGYIRYWRQGRLQLPPASDTPVLIVHGPGDKQWTYALKLTDSGSFYRKFDEQDLPTGEYTAYIEPKHGDEEPKTVTFKKESYRIPRFEINLAAPRRASIDEPFSVKMTAEYYAGGSVVGQNVVWQVTRYPYTFAPPAYPGFVFSTLERFISGRSPARDAGASRKTDKTDKYGGSEMMIDPTKEPDARPRVYIVEATVRGADEQTVTNTTQVIALPPFVLGLKTDRFLKESSVIEPQILALDHTSEPLAGKDLRLRVFQRQWHSYLVESDFTTGDAEYVNEVVDKLLLERPLTSADEPITPKIPVEEAGVYVVEISAQDKLGRLQKVSTDLFVAGDTPIAWEKPKASVFETVLDKDAYDPGESAQLLLKSPFQQARALVVVEKPDANEYHWIEVENGQGLFELPLTGDMTPSIPVHVLLLRGRLKQPSFDTSSPAQFAGRQEDRARPRALGSTVWIKVRPKSKQLKVALEHPDSALPGATIPVKILLNDPDGNPLNGEVTLWFVDRAVLALGEEQPLDPLPSLLRPNQSFVRIRDIRNEIIGDLAVEEMPGGDGVKKKPRLFDNVTVRKNFQTVPYFNPAIRVENGVAEVTVDLPDNLTEFAIRAVATDDAERFGFIKSMIAVRLPLIVQSALPRFVRPGDQFTAGGIGRVVEGEGGPGRVEIRVDGLEIEAHGQSAAQSVTWVKDRAEQLYFQLRVTQPAAVAGEDNRVTIAMAVTRDVEGASDAFEISLPVKRDRHRQKFDVFAELTPDEPFALLTPEEPPRAGSLRQEVLLTYEPALVKMLAGLNYLAGYEHGCVEQRISRLLPELALKDVLGRLGLSDRSQAIAQAMDETFNYLERAQGPDGVFSYWPGSRGYISLTAYVVEFLLTAKAQGYEFNEALLTRGLSALRDALRSDYTQFIDGHSFTERVEALYALARAGDFQEGYAQDFLARATALNLYGEAKILETFLEHQPGNQPAVTRLSNDLWQSLVFKLREGQEVYHGLQYRAESWGGLINSSEVKTIAGVIKTLHKAEPQNPRVRLVIDELIGRGAGDGWGSTNANAAALLALSDVLAAPQPPDEGQTFTLRFDDLTETLDTTGKAVTRYKTSTPGAGTLTFTAGPTDAQSHPEPIEGPLVWNTLTYFPDAPGDQVRQQNNGFVVDRELLIVQPGDAPPIKRTVRAGERVNLTVGAVVEEHLRVVNPQERYFVAVRAPFAAGFDPLNPNLATAPPEARPAGRLTREPDHALYEDDQVTFYYDTLPKGTYDFYFRLKTTFAGSYVHPAAKAELMYKQTVYGRSDGTRIEIAPRAAAEQ
jgi:alpha-2-macroglobulin